MRHHKVECPHCGTPMLFWYIGHQHICTWCEGGTRPRDPEPRSCSRYDDTTLENSGWGRHGEEALYDYSKPDPTGIFPEDTLWMVEEDV